MSSRLKFDLDCQTVAAGQLSIPPALHSIDGGCGSNQRADSFHSKASPSTVGLGPEHYFSILKGNGPRCLGFRRFVADIEWDCSLGMRAPAEGMCAVREVRTWQQTRRARPERPRWNGDYRFGTNARSRRRALRPFQHILFAQAARVRSKLQETRAGCHRLRKLAALEAVALFAQRVPLPVLQSDDGAVRAGPSNRQQNLSAWPPLRNSAPGGLDVFVWFL